jgi:hypothetical protein
MNSVVTANSSSKESMIALINKNLRYYGHKLLVGLRGLRFRVSPILLKQPVFIVGCSRAGTTLVYKTFSESRELGSLQKETHDFWSGLHPPAERGWGSHSIPEQYASQADRESVSRYFYTQIGKRRIVDKNNQNGLSIPYLYSLFPDAHFVFIKRSPGDNINSLIHGWGKEKEYGAWSDSLPEPISIDGGKYKKWCFFLANDWREYTQSSIEEVCAFQYRSINDSILESRRKIPGNQWHEVAYEDLISNPVEGFRNIFNACGLAFCSHLENHCNSVIDRPYNAFSEIKVDKWKEGANKRRIERILPDVKETAEKLGYRI